MCPRPKHPLKRGFTIQRLALLWFSLNADSTGKHMNTLFPFQVAREEHVEMENLACDGDAKSVAIITQNIQCFMP